jgi:two-component system LytT family response regulator
MITCVIIDDEPLAAELLQSYVDREPQLRLMGTFNDAQDGADFIHANKVDLLLLDIQMPHVNGIQLLKSLEKPPMVIFTTAYSEYAAEGFELDAIDYLLKPFDMRRFQRAVTKACEYHKALNRIGVDSTPYIFIKSEYQVIKINYDDIRYIEALDDYIKIYTTNSRPVLTLMTLKTILEKLPEDKFARVHRSYIISLSKMESVRNKKIKIGEIEIPIGNSYADNISKVLKKKT